MPDTFIAQSLVETNTTRDGRSFELVFVDAQGSRQAIRLPKRIAADLAPVLASLATTTGPNFTKLPRGYAIGRAPHERLVLIRFDDDPPYGLDVDEALDLCRELEEEAEVVSQEEAPARQ